MLSDLHNIDTPVRYHYWYVKNQGNIMLNKVVFSGKGTLSGGICF